MASAVAIKSPTPSAMGRHSPLELAERKKQAVAARTHEQNVLTRLCNESVDVPGFIGQVIVGADTQDYAVEGALVLASSTSAGWLVDHVDAEGDDDSSHGVFMRVRILVRLDAQDNVLVGVSKLWWVDETCDEGRARLVWYSAETFNRNSVMRYAWTACPRGEDPKITLGQHFCDISINSNICLDTGYFSSAPIMRIKAKLKEHKSIDSNTACLRCDYDYEYHFDA